MTRVMMTHAEQQAGSSHDLRCMATGEINQVTSIPLPTLEQWQAANLEDHDIQSIITALQNNEELNKDDLIEKSWHKEWRQQRLETQNGILYRYETGRQAGLRVIRATVVPPRYRHTVFSALQVSPLGGHTGFHKTYWKIAARFFWPKMTREIRQMTIVCVHCKAANIASHEMSQQLTHFDITAPFDVIAMDIWNPGREAAGFKKKHEGSYVLTSVDIMTSYAMGSFVQDDSAHHCTLTAFTAFFAITGLPKMVIIDAGSEFASTLEQMCQTVGINYYQVSRGNYKAVIVDLNKTQVLHAANCKSYHEWRLGVAFAIYGWNSAPVDRTNIIRSFAAMGREFLFPIDIEMQETTTDVPNPAMATAQHVDSMFPMLRKQQELLAILNADRRAHHRELKNQTQNETVFQPNDLVLLRKQVQTSTEKGPAKAQIKARGMYRIIRQIKPGSYEVQKIPFTQGVGRRGRLRKELAARMERLPSTLVLHRTTEGLDTRYAQLNRPYIENPLENIFGIHRFGKYRQAEPNQPFAYERVEDMWNEDDGAAENEENGNSGDEDANNTNLSNELTDSSDDSDSDHDAQGDSNENGDEEMVKDTTTITAAKRKRTRSDHENDAENTAELRRSKRVPSRLPAKLRFQGIQPTSKPPPVSEERQIAQLNAAIETSRNKLFFIKYSDSSAKAKWQVVQVLKWTSRKHPHDIEKGYIA
mmetsp:Transcript_2602/g.3881  ORF Transcript_2602/g.3881 Transcript_2602/m.3881 type:complete len:702 (-) Transcript_2602:652-2757(-)